MSAARSGRQVLEDLDLGVRLHLLDRVGHGLVVERGEHAGPVARGELVDDRRQVGRMELGEALVRNPELDRGDRRLDRVDVLPVDVALGDGPAEPAGECPEATLDPKPAEQPGGPDVDGDEARRPIGLVEPEVVDPDHLPAVDVDDLLVQQVGPEQDLVRALAEALDVDGGRAQAAAGRVE